tara:strand:- start:2775 stop:3356 length:582 start_codon:yes stop_codon:yes gene_type:complete
MILNDATIRPALLRKLSRRQPTPKAVIEELRVHNGCAIADVVSLHSEAHCYEIKGATDKIERIETQGYYYNRSFRKITLITTENHIEKAKKLAPDYWGLILVETVNSEIRFKHIRGAKNNPKFNKEIAVQTLWKSEMLSILNEERHKRKPRDFLAQLICETTNKVELNSSIAEMLLSRINSNTSKLDCFAQQS